MLQQISSLNERHSYQQKIILNHQSETKSHRLIINLDLCNGQSLFQLPGQVLIQRICRDKGFGVNCNCKHQQGECGQPR